MMSKQKYYSFIKNEGYDKIMVCFPYGGGEPQCFKMVVKDFYGDAVAIHISEFNKNMNFEDIAEKLVKELPLEKYEEVYVYGQSEGCMPALAFAEMLGEKLKCLTLVSPSVKTEQDSTLSPWKHMPDFLIKTILFFAGGGIEVCSKNALDRFRSDTDRFFKYTPKQYNICLQCRVNVIYGDRDILLKSKKTTSEIISRLFDRRKIFDIYTVKGGKHFLNKSHSRFISDVINNMI